MLQIRCFREEDAEALSRLMAQVGQESFLPVPLEQRLQRPGYFPREDLLLAEWEGQIVAYLDTFRELGIGRVVLEGAVLPGYRRQVAPLLLQRGTEHAAAIGAGAVHFPIAGGDRAARRLLGGQGFVPVRRFLRLSLDRKGVPAVPDWPRLRPMRLNETALLAHIQNLSFAGSWGFQPNTKEEIRYRLGLACCSPEGVFFALAEAQVVGYCWTRELQGKGEIWMIGVDPAWRGQGVGRALLLKGIHHLHQRGFHQVDLTVDRENSAAIVFYRSVGFRQVGTVVWYERRL